MRIYFHIFIFLFSMAWLIPGTFSMEITCPPKAKVDASPDGIHAKIQQCIEARKNRNEASLNDPSNDFYCPSGNFSIQDNQAITDWRIAMQIGISMLFSAIDYDALTKICEMRESRETDPMVWQKWINETFLTSANDETKWDSPDKSVLSRYRELCDNGGVNIMNIVNANSEGKRWISNMSSFPESLCLKRAEQKSKTWANVGYILMNEGIAKWYQNDKDKYIDKVKTKYDTVREKFHTLLEYIDKSTANLTNLIKKAVK